MTKQQLRAEMDRLPDVQIIGRIKHLLYANKKKCACVGCGVVLYRNSKTSSARCHKCTAGKALTYYHVRRRAA